MAQKHEAWWTWTETYGIQNEIHCIPSSYFSYVFCHIHKHTKLAMGCFELKAFKN